MSKIDLAIKFGSNEIIIYRKGYGIIAKEPAFLAVVESDKKMKVKAVGKEAEKLFLSKSKNVTVYQPISNSEIINEKMADIMLGEILHKVIEDKVFLTSVNALVAVPSAMTEKQLLLLRKVLHQAGVSKMNFVQNAVCVRKELNLDPHARVMVVDIGKYITDISILNDFSFDFGRMYFVGGNDMDKSITTFIADNHELEVSDLTSENIKNEIASLYDRDMYSVDYIGIDNANEKYVKRDITAHEIKLAIANIYDQIFEFIKEIIKSQPKEIAIDLHNNGVVFVGGASAISGLYEYAKKKLDIPVSVIENPSDAVILGAGKLLSADSSYLKINF